MLQLLRKFFKWLLRLLGEPGEHTQAEGAVTPPGKFSSPELGLATSDSPKYRKSKSLLTYPERVFYWVLLEAVNNEYLVFVKVRMGDFVFLSNEPVNKKYYANQVLCKHVDFLLCERETQKPLLVIELDDSSHSKYDHRERDEFKDRTFAAIGLPIRRVKVQPRYLAADLREQIFSAIQEKPVK